MTCKLCLLNDPRCKCSKSASTLSNQPSTKTKESKGECGYPRLKNGMCGRCPDYGLTTFKEHPLPDRPCQKCGDLYRNIFIYVTICEKCSEE